MNLIHQLQDELTAALEADPWFDDVPIVSRRKGDVGSDMTESIQNLVIGGGVWIPRLSVAFPNVDRPEYQTIDITVGFIENRILNRTGKPAEEAVLRAASILHMFNPASISAAVVLAQGAAIFEVPPEDERANTVAWQANFTTRGGASYSMPKVALPVIVNVLADVFEITCATPGAAIFYTHNGTPPTAGTYPSPRSGALYTAAFNSGSGQVTIKARAWLAGYLPSDLVQQTFSV